MITTLSHIPRAVNTHTAARSRNNDIRVHVFAARVHAIAAIPVEVKSINMPIIRMTAALWCFEVGDGLAERLAAVCPDVRLTAWLWLLINGETSGQFSR